MLTENSQNPPKSFKGQSEGGDEEQMVSLSGGEPEVTGLEWKGRQGKRRHTQKQLSGSCRFKRIVGFYVVGNCRHKRARLPHKRVQEETIPV